jgi:hypothetical protein
MNATAECGMQSLLAISFLLAFVWVAGGNLVYLAIQLRHAGQGPSFVFLLGPLMALMFLLANPWGLSDWWWLLPLADVGLWVLAFAIFESLRGP